MVELENTSFNYNQDSGIFDINLNMRYLLKYTAYTYHEIKFFGGNTH